MIQPFVDAAMSIPVWVWCALIVAGVIIGFGVLLVVRALQEDVRPHPARGRAAGSGERVPLGSRSPRLLRFGSPLARAMRVARARRREAQRQCSPFVKGGHLR